MDQEIRKVGSVQFFINFITNSIVEIQFFGLACSPPQDGAENAENDVYLVLN